MALFRAGVARFHAAEALSLHRSTLTIALLPACLLDQPAAALTHRRWPGDAVQPREEQAHRRPVLQPLTPRRSAQPASLCRRALQGATEDRRQGGRGRPLVPGGPARQAVQQRGPEGRLCAPLFRLHFLSGHLPRRAAEAGRGGRECGEADGPLRAARVLLRGPPARHGAAAQGLRLRRVHPFHPLRMYDASSPAHQSSTRE